MKAGWRALGAVGCVAAALAAAGCGGSGGSGSATAADRAAVAKPSAAVPRQAAKHARAAGAAGKRAGATRTGAAAKRAGAAAAKRIPHVPAPRSKALRPHIHHAATKTSAIAPGAPSDAEVERELAKAMGYKPGEASARTVEDHAILQPSGLVVPPPSAPYAVQAIITGGNEVAHLPYVYGGGHGTWIDTAYDCSGSVSFALANAGFLTTQEDSTELSHFGAPGPGKWVTIYANAQHAYMVVAGIRFDTSGRTGPRGSRWQAAMRSGAGFAVRHPPGL